VVSGDIYVLAPKDTQRLLPELLPFLCLSERFFQHAVGTSAGSLSPRTNWSSLASFEFDLPPLDQQRRIAEILWAVDEVAVAFVEAKSAADEAFKERLRDFFDSAVSETHRLKKAGELCEITSSKRIFASDYVAEGVPFYRGKEITEKFKGNQEVSIELFISEGKFAEIEKRFGAPVKGDLLLTSVGTLGSPYVVKDGERFYFKDGNLTWFRNFLGLDSYYLFYWLISPAGKAALKRCTIGTSQSAITIVRLKDMEIPVFSLEEQQVFVREMQRLDGLRSQIADHIARTQCVLNAFTDMIS
jgi:restriction endonuclease S subunit